MRFKLFIHPSIRANNEVFLAEARKILVASARSSRRQTHTPLGRSLRDELHARVGFSVVLVKKRSQPHEVQNRMAHNQRPKPSKARVRVSLHEPVRQMKRQHGRALVQVV